MPDNAIASLPENITSSPLYNADLAPVPPNQRTWNKWHLAALWVGMAVCIPTYMLSSYMVKSGLSWQAALIIIALANVIISIPMVLNGHAGVKYGLPFPVLGRAAFGTAGIHLVAIVRAIVACGWFGVQTWIGGLAIYAIWNALTGNHASMGLDLGKFLSFAVFWLINIYFIWSGSESIKWLENLSAPFLIVVGIVLIWWCASEAGGYAKVLDQGVQLQKPAAILHKPVNPGSRFKAELTPLLKTDGNAKADEFKIGYSAGTTGAFEKAAWAKIPGDMDATGKLPALKDDEEIEILNGSKPVLLQYRVKTESGYAYSSVSELFMKQDSAEESFGTAWNYVLWLTAMVGFWATMSLNISDITRYAPTQKDQVAGQFIGLPGTMVLYSFIGIFVTCSTVINFPELLIGTDAPWDPVTFFSRFNNPWIVVLTQISMLIATLSTNIAANIIAPANIFSNLAPGKLSFRTGGVLAGIIGIIICPWWLMDEISNLLVFVSGLLGPVLGILLCDYFLIRTKTLDVNGLFKVTGPYAYGGSGYNMAAMIALCAGVITALIGYWVPSLLFLYKLSWFTGFGVSFALYAFLYPRIYSSTSVTKA
ncbi:MAG: NCS1 family nucleobase:cation symporter-1 [Bacteroidota bacterium]